MCDYSLEHLASRPAKVGDKLITTSFKHCFTGGFCASGDPNVAVCLKPGTELAFDREIRIPGGFLLLSKKLGHRYKPSTITGRIKVDTRCRAPATCPSSCHRRSSHVRRWHKAKLSMVA